MAVAQDITSSPPRLAGQMGASMVVPLHAVIERKISARDRDGVFLEAGISELPDEDDFVPESKVARLHQLVWERWPDEAPEIMDLSGRVAAEVFVENYIPQKARLLLQNMPWSISAWLVGKSARHNAWIFSGSGMFAIQTTSRLALFQNPLSLHVKTDRPSCHFYAAMFEHMYQRLSHRDFTCREIACVCSGADHCAFEITI